MLRLSFSLWILAIALTVVALVVIGAGLQNMAALRAISASTGLLLLLLASAAAWRMRRLFQRFDDLLVATARAAGGASHIFVPDSGDDELSTLARSINGTMDRARRERLALEPERVLERAMVRESPNGVMVVDGHGRVQRCNPATLRLLPQVPGEPVGRPVSAFGLPELLEVVVEAGTSRAAAERSATVGRMDLLLRGVPLADGAACLILVLDISTLRRAERARREFVANVSHELRTPITTLTGYSETLLDDAHLLPPHMIPMIQAIERNARRLQALTEDVLHLSRIEARTADLPLEVEPVAPLVEEVLERFSQRSVSLGVRLHTTVERGVRALVNVQAFEHALGNLVDNAIKYSGEGRDVYVDVATKGGAVEVAVRDEGAGIPAIHHDRLFERFYRVDEGRSRAVGGTGLGLALVKHLCLATRSEVRMESEEGRGSTFTLRLPLGVALEEGGGEGMG